MAGRTRIPFWILPITSACVWIAMLLAMLIVWLAQGSPHYAFMDADQHIAFISDVGATGLKPLFVAGSCITTVFLDLSFASERWLRHTGALERNTTTVEKVLSAFAIFFAIAGTAGLILLSVFDTSRYPHLHDGFLLLFIGGYIISAIFICAEYQRLGIHFRDRRILRMSFWMKLAFILVELALAIAFGVCQFTNGTQNIAAVLEWIIALIFTFWVLSFFIDLMPASHMGLHKRSVDSAGLELGNGYGPTITNGNSTTHTHTTTTTNGYTNGRTNGNVNGYTNGGQHTVENGALKLARPVTPSQNF